MNPATSAGVATACELQQGIGLGFTVAFNPDECRVTHMRKITAAHLRLWRVPEPTADSVILAVSELVTNGIQHGHGAVALKVICSDGVLRVEVTEHFARSPPLGCVALRAAGRPPSYTAW